MKWEKFLAGVLAAAMMTAAGTATAGAALHLLNDDVNRDGIFVNGKDTKSPDGSYDGYYKTAVFQFSGTTVGTKLQVAVLPAEYGSVEQFAALFQNGKINPAVTKMTKDIATARLDAATGKVTVTAKKKAGTVNVFVYEVVNKQLVWNEDGGIGQEYGVGCDCPTKVTVYIAPSGITYTTDPSKLTWEPFTKEELEEGNDTYTTTDGSIKENWERRSYAKTPILKKGDKGGLTLSVGDEPVTVYLADKKVSVDTDEYEIENTFDPSVIGLTRLDGDDLFSSLIMLGTDYTTLYDINAAEREPALDEINAALQAYQDELSKLKAQSKKDDATEKRIEELEKELAELSKNKSALESAYKTTGDKGKGVYAFTVVPKSPGKTTINISEPISGKKLKIKVTVKK